MLLSKANFGELVVRDCRTINVGKFDVKIQSLLIEDQLEIEKLNNKKDKQENELVFLMLKLSCVDEHGEKILDDENVRKLPSNIALKLFDECLKINGLNNKELENRAKNS